MNCFTHPNVVAVAQCGNGCGRALCQECAQATNPPICRVCAEQMVAEHEAALIDARTFYKKRILKNSIYYALLVVLFVTGRYIETSGNSPLYLIILLLGYGLVMGRNGASAVWQVPGATTVVTNTEAFYLRLVQAAFIGLFSIFFVPIIIILDVIRMSKLPAGEAASA